MRLSKIGYYADFVIYPLLITAATVWALLEAGPGAPYRWLVAVLGGLIIWTLLEYAIHRLVLHRITLFADMHATHHDAPIAKIGTPSWITLAILLIGIFYPSYLALGPVLGNGVTVGIMAGFFWYSCIHHAIYNWQIRRGSYLHAVKRRHARHHHVNSNGNFGVTTPLWDHLLKSTLPSRSESSVRRS